MNEGTKERMDGWMGESMISWMDERMKDEHFLYTAGLGMMMMINDDGALSPTFLFYCMWTRGLTIRP